MTRELKSKIAPNYVDLAPPYAGLLHGLCDTLQSCAGFIIPVWSYPFNFDQFLLMIQIMMGAVINGNSTTIKGWSPFWYIIVLIQIFSFLQKFEEKLECNFFKYFSEMAIFESVYFRWNNRCWSIGLSDFCFCWTPAEHYWGCRNRIRRSWKRYPWW